MSRVSCLLGAFVGMSVLVGCGPSYVALTVPPPSAEARLDSEENALTLSQGVALAFECTTSRGPCEGPTVTVDDASIATVLPTLVDRLAPKGINHIGATPRSVFTVVGHAPGETVLRLQGDGAGEITVTVVAR